MEDNIYYDLYGTSPLRGRGFIDGCLFEFKAILNDWEFTAHLKNGVKKVKGKYGGKVRYPCTYLPHKKASKIVDKCIQKVFNITI